MIELQNISHEFGNRKLFNGLHLQIQERNFVSFVGPSGCGKSTLLRIVAGLLNPTHGEVKNPYHEKQGFVFQEPRLLKWRTAFENVQLPLEIHGDKNRDKSSNTEKINQKLKLVGLQHNSGLYPAELSGGMKMRVSIARALVFDPHLLILDEPFSALDEHTKYSLQNELVKITRDLQQTTLFVTHSLSESLFLSNRIIGLNDQGQKSFEFSVENKNQDPQWRNSDHFFSQLQKLSQHNQLLKSVDLE